jgi:hypothetical protein
MPIRLTNIPASFEDRMTHIVKDLQDNGVVVYIDDILIYAKYPNLHDKLREEVLERLANNDVIISDEKYILVVKDVEFLHYIITLDVMRIAIDKTETI